MSEPDDNPASAPSPVQAPARGVSAGGAGLVARRIWAIATNTFTQLVRMRVFVFLIIFVAILAAVFALFVTGVNEQELKGLRDIGFGAMDLFTMMFAVVGTAILIPKDIEDRTLYTVLSKPVRRFEYLFGKLVGLILLIFVSLLIMDVLFCGVLWLRESIMAGNLEAGLAASEPGSIRAINFADELERVRHIGFRWQIQGGVAVIFMKGCIIASLAMLLSTFASSTLFTVIVGASVVIIGYGQELARSYLMTGESVGMIGRIISVFLALLFPDFALYGGASDAVSGGEVITGAIFSKLALLALFYVFLYNLVSYLVFAEKEL